MNVYIKPAAYICAIVFIHTSGDDIAARMVGVFLAYVILLAFNLLEENDKR